MDWFKPPVETLLYNYSLLHMQLITLNNKTDYFYYQHRSRGLIALATATSGVAATIMPGGRTTHSRFDIPLNPNEGDVCNTKKQSAN